jgi:hypothetical protein
MKKLLLLALPVLAAVLVIPAAFAGNGPAPKATGDIWYTNQWTGEPTHVTFVAQDLGNDSAKGSLSYQDLRGSYQAEVTEAHLGNTPNSFSFTARITSSTGAYAEGASEPRPAGTLVPLVVTDNGQSGVNGVDSITWVNPADGHAWDLGPLTAGNIQIHS